MAVSSLSSAESAHQRVEAFRQGGAYAQGTDLFPDVAAPFEVHGHVPAVQGGFQVRQGFKVGIHIMEADVAGILPVQGAGQVAETSAAHSRHQG